MPFESQYADSDADDEYERGGAAAVPHHANYEPLSPTDSDPPSNEDTPTTFTHPRSAGLPEGIITTWSPGDCADYLASLGLEQYGDAMIDEGIDGQALVVMQHVDLKDMGIVSAGHRLTILKAVYDTKLKHNIPIEEEHYVPLSADVGAPEFYVTQEELTRVLNEIKLRDQRIMAELRVMKEDLNRVMEEQKKLREDALPVIRMAKDRSQPLPTPDAQQHDPMSLPPSNLQQPEHKIGSGLSRKFSAKKLLLGSNPVNPSPTIREGLADPSPGISNPSHLNPNTLSGPQLSPGIYSQQNSPTSPPPFTGTLNSVPSRTMLNAMPNSQHWSTSTLADRNSAVASINTAPPRRDAPDPPSSVAPSSAPSGVASDFMKSFRVSQDAPCHKVLPVALKKYHINDDWRQYSLYIVSGDQERCLGLDEKPLVLFKQLSSENRQPMFMLRKHATPQEGFVATREKPVPDGAGGLPGQAAQTQMPSAQSRVQSTYGTVQLPGGVL